MSRRTEQLCEELKVLAERIGLKVREEILLREVGYHARSGTCRVHGEDVLFIDRSLGPTERLEILIDGLRGRDLEGLYVSPALRRLLQGRAADQEPQSGDSPAQVVPDSEAG